MSRWFFTLLILFFSEGLCAKANSSENSTSVILSPIQANSRYARQTDGQYVWLTSKSFAAGMFYQKHLMLLDYASHEDTSGNASLLLKRGRTEWLFNYRYMVYALTPSLHLSLGGGLGIYEDQVQSRVGTETITDSSGAQMMASGAVGFVGEWNHLFYALEFQGLMGRDFEPQPTVSVVGRLGVQFVIF